MSGRFMDRGQIVAYEFETKRLIVTVSDKTATKMMADGWQVHHEDELGYFVVIEGES
jgi:mannose-6-phosphate isomerase-like protein (cupin superfamily)